MGGKVLEYEAKTILRRSIEIGHEEGIKKEGQVDYFCTNTKCPARHIEGLIHFASRDAMNIDGLGDRIMEDFYNFKFIGTMYDIPEPVVEKKIKEFIEVFDLNNLSAL